MFSNGSLPFTHNHIEIIHREDIRHKGNSPGGLPLGTPMSAWFGATFDKEKDNFMSDYDNETVIFPDDDRVNNFFLMSMIPNSEEYYGQG